MRALALILTALFAAPQSGDPVEALRDMAKRADASKARATLVDGLDREVAAGMRALEEGKPDQIELRLSRVATLARSYNEAYARLLVGLILSARRQVRQEGAALVRAVAEDIRQGKPYAERLAAARKDGVLRVYPDQLGALEARAKEWAAAPPKPEAVDEEAAKWLKLRRAAPAPGGVEGPAAGCATCGGAGETPCTCKGGMVVGPCRMCGGTGAITCLLCEGQGTVAHHGYVGMIRLTLEKAVTVKVVLKNGKNAMARIEPQVLTWTLGPCDGKGTFTLKTSSKPLDPNAKRAPPQQLEQSCERFWKELRNFGFSGRAKIEIQNESGKLAEMTPQAAKRFFADYEKCASGRLPCERCEGKLKNPCVSCTGRGSWPVPCDACSGATVRLCGACGFVGDTGWLAALVPGEAVRGLPEALERHGEAVRSWAQYRVWALARRETLSAQLGSARQGLDPTAVLTPIHVSLTCPACKGKGGECEECWGTGRREYYEGTPQYERYAAVARLERQIGELAVECRRPAPLPAVRFSDAPPPKPADKPPGPPKPPPSRPVGGTIEGLPPSIRNVITAADKAGEEGIKHLEAAKTANDNAETWIAESAKALEKLREAQTGYTGAQEACDAQALDTPPELLAKIRKNLQALVIARKQAP